MVNFQQKGKKLKVLTVNIFLLIAKNCKFRFQSLLGCLVLLVCFYPWASPAVYALTFLDNSAATFNTGTYTNSQYNSSRGGVDVVTPNKNSTYESSIKNAGSSTSWNSLTWTQEQKYAAEMPSNQGADTGYTQNLSMANNQAYYKFNESAGSTFADSSGNANDITATGGISPATTTASIFTRSMQTNTQYNQYSKLPSGVTSKNQTKYTIMFWINPGTITNPGTNTIYEEAQGMSATPRLSISLVNGVLQFSGRPLDNDLTTTIWVSASQAITANNWFHVAAVYDSTSSTNNMKLYVSGVANSASVSVPTIANTQNLTTLPRLTQGVANTSNTVNNTKFVAKIDELTFFTRALSASEVAGFYRRGAWNQSLLARSCLASDCSGATYVGPTGSAVSPFVNDGLTSSNTSSLSATYFPSNQYFQYKIIFTVRLTGQAIDFSTNATSSIINSVSIDYTTSIPPPTLSFSIRNSADTANTNVCALSMQNTSAVSTCSYRLKVSTNSASGYIVYIQTSSGLSNGSYSIANAAVGSSGSGGNDISNTTSGVEKYGVVITPGSLSSGSAITLAGSFNAGTNAVLVTYISPPTAILTANGQNAPAATDLTNTSLITHKLNISQTTPPRNYSQSIIYTVSSSF